MSLALALAIIADLTWGEPQVKWHPVALIGRFLASVAGRLRRVGRSPLSKRITGGILVAVFSGLTYLVAEWAIMLAGKWNIWSSILVQAGLFWLSISIGELVKVAKNIDSMIEEGQLDEARNGLLSLVGRDTDQLDATQIRSAAIESVAENLVDAGVAPVFYLLLGGAPLALTYRIVNTLDSMFGYKTEELIDFGWASARLDDIASWVPARLAVLLISLAGWLSGRPGFTSFRAAVSHGRRHASPNSGLPIAAMAGALRIRLGGSRAYGGTQTHYGYFGDENQPISSDIMRQAGVLVKVSIMLIGVIAMTAVFLLKGPLWPIG